MLQKGQPAIIAGVILLVIGGVLITLGWDGAASKDCVQCQFPYLLSASIPGLALIVIGMAILVLAIMRRDALERDAQLEKLASSMNDLLSTAGPRDPYDPRTSGEYRPRPRAAANGSDGDAATVEIGRPVDFEQGS